MAWGSRCVLILNVHKVHRQFQNIPLYLNVGRTSSVGIVTSYGLDGPGMRSAAPVHTDPLAHPASCTVDTGHFQGVKRQRGGIYHPPLTPRLKKVELHLCSPSGNSKPVLGRNLFYLKKFSLYLKIENALQNINFTVDSEQRT